MIRTIILKSNIDNDFWPEFVLEMTYIKNSQPTQVLENISLYKAQFYK